MAIEDLSNIAFTRELLSIVFIIISLIIGVKLILKHFELKQKTFITVGLTWIFLSAAWSNSIQVLISYSLDIPINETLSLILTSFFSAPAIICWMYSFTNLVHQRFQKEVFYIFLIIFGIYEIILTVALFLYPPLIGVVKSMGVVQIAPFTLIFSAIVLIVAVITGLIMSNDAMNSNTKEIVWKGRFLVIAFISFAIATLLDLIYFPYLIKIIFVKTLLIISGITYYLGFFLPDKLKNLLVQQK